MIILNVEPYAKPQGIPNWGNKAWDRYFQWRDKFTSELLNKRLSVDDLFIPFEVRFFVSKGFTKNNLGKPRDKRPDYDNYLKAFTDAWFGGFEKITGEKRDDGCVWGGYGLKFYSPIAFIQIVPATMPDRSDIIQIIQSQLYK